MSDEIQETVENVKPKKKGLLDYPILFGLLVKIFTSLLFPLLFAFLFWLLLEDFFPDSLFDQIAVIIYFSATSLLVCVLIAFFVKRKLGKSFRLGFDSKNFYNSMNLSFSIFVWLLAAFVFIAYVGRGILKEKSFIIMLVMGVLVPSVSNELVCRGLLVGNMMRCWKERGDVIYRSVICSALILGVFCIFSKAVSFFSMPLQYAVLSVIIQAAFVTAQGILLGAIYVRTRNLWGVIIGDSVLNLVMFLFSKGKVLNLLNLGGNTLLILIYTILIIHCVLLGLYIIRPAKHEEILENWNWE